MFVYANIRASHHNHFSKRKKMENVSQIFHFSYISRPKETGGPIELQPSWLGPCRRSFTAVIISKITYAIKFIKHNVYHSVRENNSDTNCQRQIINFFYFYFSAHIFMYTHRSHRYIARPYSIQLFVLATMRATTKKNVCAHHKTSSHYFYVLYLKNIYNQGITHKLNNI